MTDANTTNLKSTLAFLVFCLSFGCDGPPAAKAPVVEKHSGGEAACLRIVSLAPSLTEMLFALGLGDKVVGVTRFCAYPAETADLPKVGGYYDPNLEAILALRPNLVVLFGKQDEVISHLDELGISMLQVQGDTVADICNAMLAIGRKCEKSSEADTLVTDLQRRMHRISVKTAGCSRPRVLVCVSRNLDGEGLADVYAAGLDGYFDELLSLAGGRTAYDRPGIRFPQLSAEGIMEINPEVIVDLCPHARSPGQSVERLKNDWSSLETVSAVVGKHVYILTEDYVTVPGPRFILLLEKLAELLHPEIDWQQP